MLGLAVGRELEERPVVAEKVRSFEVAEIDLGRELGRLCWVVNFCSRKGT